MSKLNVQFNEVQTKALARMAADLETTRVDVIRRALQLLAIARREIAAGNEIGVVRDGKILKTIVVLG